MTSLGLKWIAEYHGPSLAALTPVVCSELSADAELEIVTLVHAIKELWRYSKFEQLELDDVLQQHSSDSLLMLGAAASSWARAALNEVRGYVMDAGAQRDGDVVRLWVGFHHAQLSREVVQIALQSLVRLITGQFKADKFNSKIERLWIECRQRHPDYQARIVMTAARQRGTPYAPAWGMQRHWRFGEGVRSRVLFESSSSDDSHFGMRIQGDKVTSKRLLTQLGLPTPRFALVKAEDQVMAAVEKVGFPLVAKPIDRSGGKGVSAGIMSLDAAVAGFRQARAFSESPILFEAHLEGEDHRLMVVDGKCVAAIRREPPQVVGDGHSTIRQLVDGINHARNAQSLVRSGYLRPISLDASATLHLAGICLSENSVLEKDRSIRVRSNANLSTGGYCVDVTERLHPHVRSMAESLAQTLNLRMMGADYLTSDIARDPNDFLGGFIEFNSTPGLDALIAAGWLEEQAGALCLPDRVGPVPKVLLVVDSSLYDEFTVTMRKLQWPKGAGWASTSQAALSGAPLAVQDAHPWAGPQLLLSHANLRIAVVLARNDDIIKHGTPAAQFDRTMIAGNVSPGQRKLLMSISGYVNDLPQDATPTQVVQSALQQLTSNETVAAERQSQ